MIIDKATLFSDEPQKSEFWGSFGTCLKKTKKKSYSAFVLIFVRIFSSFRFLFFKPWSNFEDIYEPAMSDKPSENIGKVLFSYFLLYILVDKWEINNLKRLILSKIYKILTIICLN